MIKKAAIAIVALLVLLTAAGFFWARSILATDTVRTALAAQISAAIGQPVTIRSISAGIYPRVTVILEGVAIGQPARIQAETAPPPMIGASRTRGALTNEAAVPAGGWRQSKFGWAVQRSPPPVSVPAKSVAGRAPLFQVKVSLPPLRPFLGGLPTSEPLLPK